MRSQKEKKKIVELCRKKERRLLHGQANLDRCCVRPGRKKTEKKSEELVSKRQRVIFQKDRFIRPK